jgi:hypothetical protein
MSTLSFSNGSPSSSDDLISSSSDENILGDMDQNDLIIFQMMAMTFNSNDLFISNEIEGGHGAICESNHGSLACFGYYASHIDIIKCFDKLYIGGI